VTLRKKNIRRKGDDKRRKFLPGDEVTESTGTGGSHFILQNRTFGGEDHH